MPAGYYRFPTIHADRVVFAAEDDLWTVPAAGGLARRLTSGVGEATRPWLSPDGEWLAFTSSEEGPPEIFVMPAEGGASQRLTYLGGGSTLVAGWTADGCILFTSNAHHWYLRYHQVYSIDRLGQDLRLLDVGLAHAISADPAGGVVLARNPADPARWKRYRGGTAGQLWIDPDGSGEYRPLIRTGGNLASPQWVGGRIYFISDHEGVGNLYSCLPDGSDLQRHTHHADFYARNLAADSARLVYHAGADLYLFNPATGAGGKIEVQFNSPQTQRKRKFVFAARYLEGARLHPKGHSLAVTVRGQLFSFANWEGAVTQYAPVSESQPAEPATAVRLRRPTWLNDGKRLLAVSDEGGEENLALIQADSGAYERLEGLDIGRVTSMRANPRKNQAAITNHRLELAVIDLDTRQLRLVDRGAARPIEGFDWSPDGEWLVYSRSLTNNVSQLRLWQAATGEIHNLTGEEFRDVYPHFDPSGRSILFLSYRQFEPVMDHLHFDLGFPRGMRPCLITLQQDLPNPFIPRLRLEEDKKPGDPPAEPAPAAQPGAEDGNPAEDRPAEAEPVEKAEPAKPAPAGEKLPPPVKIDLEGIQQRILAFPVAVGRYGGIFATRDGKTLYTRAPGDTPLADELAADELPTRYTLYTYSFEEQKEEVYLGGVSYFELTPDGSFILIRAGNGLRVLRAG
jgi:tricorn protease